MENSNFAPDADGNLGGEHDAAHMPESEPKKPISLRAFVGGIGKLIALGVLSHFGLLAGKSLAGANDDWCPYGTPGEGDVCDPGNFNADKCLDGSNTNDMCPVFTEGEDACPTGLAYQDQCPPEGNFTQGDECMGGGGEVGGQEQDTCGSDGTGDQCSQHGMPEFGGHDNCNADNPDQCDASSDDTCTTGTPGSPWNPGGGQNDECWSTMPATFSDKCFDGSDAQDECVQGNQGGDWGNQDTCFGDNTDHCGGLLHPFDKDECYGGMAPDDRCPPGKEDDVCLDNVGGSDECRPGRESADREGGST